MSINGWQERSPRVADIDVPILVIAFWYNIGLHLRGTILGYEQLTSTKKLLALGGIDSEAQFFDPDFLNEYIAPWYDHWLKDEENGVMDAVARDVPPPSTMVTRGWLKASHRALDPDLSTPGRPYHTHMKPEPIEPGKIIRYDIEIWPTSYLFHKGNRIRIGIGNGDSMIADGLFHHYYGHKVGCDLIYHDAEHP